MVKSIFDSEIEDLSTTRSHREKTYGFYIDDTIKNRQQFRYPNNTIKTTKYNVITFLPKALFFQFMRLANVYFLFTGVINCIPVITPLASGTALIPFVVVLCVSLIRELVEDVIRAQVDKDQNNEIAEKYSNGKWIKEKSGKLEVGEIIKVNQDSTFPADIILLTSNLPEGLCYIETGTLDGEKNLKIKQASIQTMSLYANYNIDQIIGISICDMPNPFLYHLIGKLKLSHNGKIVEVPLDSKQLLLKGAKLRNTQWVVGIIVYAGNNSKIMLNAKKPRMKYSKVENLMNKMLIFIFLSQILLCVICAILHKVYYNNNLSTNPYINQMDFSIEVDSVINYFSFVLLLNTMIPISLIITMEIVKIIQVVFILLDAEGYSLIKNRSIKPNSVNLNEELGAVDYIFTDKTGTLTCNKMVFKYCVIGDVCYQYIRDNEKSNGGSNSLREEIIPFVKGEMLNNLSKDKLRNSPNPCSDPASNGKSNDCFNTPNKIIEEYWKSLALCHDCTIEGEGEKEQYIGMSPDSIELVRAAKDQGYQLTNSGRSSIKRLQMGNDPQHYFDFEKLLLIEFSSDRKREAIIVKDNGIIKLYIKGADNIIENRLSPNSSKIYLSQCQRYVNHFSSHGFRTLFVAMKTIEEKEWENISQQLTDANLDLDNKDRKLELLFDSIERELYLLGATIVEDKLQDKVPDTIFDLKLAGIKIWMLTGDKMSTAYNIALSCNLLNKNLKTFFLEGKEIQRNEKLTIVNQEECEEVIITFAKQYAKYSGEHLNNSNPSPFGIVIDEKALLTVTDNPEMTKIFLNIAKDAKSVICCRVSPLQKSQVVKIMKDFDNSKILLAIGDGGNDVSMIMEANIGIGIYGEEGLRAVQSSDYAIGEFKILRRLLLFHGRTNNIRICEMIVYFFYKNFVFTINHFFFGFYSNFGAQTIIDDWYITLYNLILTAFPLGARACLDFDIKPDDGIVINQMLPFLYDENRSMPQLTKTSFSNCIVKGIIHAVINYFWTIYVFDNLAVNNKGDLADLWLTSVSIFTNIIIVVSIDLIINTKYHTWINWSIMFVLTVLLYAVFLVFVHFWTQFNSVGTMVVAFGSGTFWLDLVFVVLTCSLFTLATNFFKMTYEKKISYSLEKLVKTKGRIDDVNMIKNIAINEKIALYGKNTIEKEIFLQSEIDSDNKETIKI